MAKYKIKYNKVLVDLIKLLLVFWIPITVFVYLKLYSISIVYFAVLALLIYLSKPYMLISLFVYFCIAIIRLFTLFELAINPFTLFLIRCSDAPHILVEIKGFPNEAASFKTAPHPSKTDGRIKTSHKFKQFLIFL